jgi:hypothetical protein
MREVGEVVPDGPNEDLGLRQPLMEPGRVGRVEGTGLEGEIRDDRRSEPIQDLVAKARPTLS